ncbi:RNAse R [Alteromonadaceae bacterium Bs31]|nr:RNAse R [Alteromonadaceae bacterium Bs31]
MLDKESLSRLTQLKTDIQSSKEYGHGIVAGTTGRFGFVRLEDNRDAFLSPEKMQYLIPGDKVKVSLTKNTKDQLEATIEKLQEQGLTRFLGQYRVTKKGHFVVPLGDTPGLKASPVGRWIFLPPKARGRCKEGDFVVAKLTQHPIKDGKASAKILERLGQENEAYIERQFIAAKFDLIPRYNETAQKQLKSLEELFNKQEFGAKRSDLTALPFVTIDAASTRDMDDALALEKQETENGTRYTLHVAIADPSHFITQESSLAQYAQRAGQSLYLLGGSISMLPETLANNCFSLRANEKKPALVCSQVLDENGKIESFEFKKALVESKHKLSYQGVSALLKNEADEEYSALPDAIKSMLTELAALAEVRLKYRHDNYLVGHEQQEFDIQLNKAGKIEAISPREKTIAHSIVEEAMLATNICGGQLLQQQGHGLFNTHKGFRADRIGEINALLKEEEIEHGDLLNEQDYLTFVHALLRSDKAHLISPLRRMMPSSALSFTPAPHLGMGLPHYATITSPIRRFADLYNHWAISAAVGAGKFKPFNESVLEGIQQTQALARQADRELFQWLICQYTESLVGTNGKAKIRIVTQQGFGARLESCGVDGFVLFPKKQEKSFDAKRMTLTVGENTFKLEQLVDVKVESVDMDKRRIAFSLAN